ncbi:MAG: L,D-transpeptidase [Anaerolineaceae bacterium]|nr:L,D-transpeptidase [Anaerolineaceae bacterium]
MRNRFSWLIITSLFIWFFFIGTCTAHAQDTGEPLDPQYEETFEGMPICAPGIYLIPPADCLPAGPSQTLTGWARNGLTFPLKPLPAFHPDASYLELDQKYAKLNLPPGTQASYYPNIESAVKGWGALGTLPIGKTLYVAYRNVSYYDGNPYVQNERGEWLRASPANYSSFQGLLFNHPPENDFGWIVDFTYPRREPSYNAPIINEQLVPKTVIQVYQQVEAEGTTWSMIGMGKWVERHAIRVVSPHLTPPSGIENGRWIEVNLYEQTLTVYEDNRLKFATLIGSGYDPYYTQPGLFHIREKKELETMTGSFEAGKADYYLLENVPWTMYYDGPRALHGAYWRVMFGFELSHGCVNMSIGDAHWLYDWAVVGDYVYVWDPSGSTPTDPAFYQKGVAF